MKKQPIKAIIDMQAICEHVFNTCLSADLIETGDCIMVAVSGGPDSTALLHILNDLKPRLNIELAAAHFHHGLRGEEADRDAGFVEQLSNELGLPFIMEWGDVAGYREKNRLSLQEAARDLRLQFLEEARRSMGARKIALGHTRDDQTEELVMRLIRGTGPEGLAGMLMMRDNVFIRPLLHIPKADLLHFLRERGLAYVEDKSNQDLRYLRNRIRHQCLPLLRELNPSLDLALHRLSFLAQVDNGYWRQEQFNLLRQLVIYEHEGLLVMDRSGLCGQHGALLRRLLKSAGATVSGSSKALNFSHINSVYEAIQGGSPNTHLDLPHGLQVDVSYREVVFSRRDSFKSGFIYTLEKPGFLAMEKIQSQLVIEHRPMTGAEELDLGPWQAVVDAGLLDWPLTIRSVHPGDRMLPLGMENHKKLKDLFINRKVPRWKRPLLPVIESGSDIIWVAGIGPGEQVKVTSQTSSFLHIALKGPLCAF